MLYTKFSIKNAVSLRRAGHKLPASSMMIGGQVLQFVARGNLRRFLANTSLTDRAGSLLVTEMWPK